MGTFKLAALFSDNMVLQQGIRNLVWGWSDAGQGVTISVAGRKARGTTRKNGRWQVKLPALPAGGPYDMVVSGPHVLTIRNVMIGEVWLASGQSNMQMTVGTSLNAAAEVESANHPGLRMFTVPNVASMDPLADVRGMWEVCTPKTVSGFSAVGYFFARELHQRLGVAVGVIHSSWGGTPAEAWTSRKALRADPALRPIVLRFHRGLKNFDREFAAYQEKMKDESKHYPADPGNTGFAEGWAAPETAIASWGTMQVPGSWQGAGLNYNGVVWFRRDVDIPAAWAGQDLTLNLAPCDKHDTTYFNNVEVGGIGLENPDAWKTPRSYRIPGKLVRAGRNVIAVRIYSYVYAGGFMGSPAEMKLDPPDGASGESPVMLHGDWRYQVEHNFGPITPVALQAPLGPGNQNSPYSLYNGMIAPLVPYGLRGAIWYQGESNAGRPAEYRALFPAMIRCWRHEWKQGDFPFLLVQLANYMAANEHPVESQWAELREAQALALKLPNTGMAVAIDIGDATDIHPKNKQDVGKRLAAWGLSAVYGRKDVVPSGPLYAGMAVEGSRIRIRFQHVGGGLVVRGGGRLTGFAIAGPSPAGLPRRFVWANAEVDGDTVVVSSPSVPAPEAVRYAWANNPACNLCNAAGLPAAPFRTDGPA